MQFCRWRFEEFSMSEQKTPGKLTQIVLKGSMVVVSAKGFGLLLKVAFLAILARLLTPADFGLVAIGVSFAAFARLLGDSGMTLTLVQRRDLRADHISTAFVCSIVTGIGLGMLTVGTAHFVEAFFQMPGLKPVLMVLSISFALRAFSIVPNALLMRASSFRDLAMIDLASFALGYGLISTLLALMGFGVWSLVFGVVGQSALASIFAFIRAPHRLSVRFSRVAFKELLSSSVWFSAAGFANVLALQADNLIVGRVLGAEALGFYSRAYQLMTLPATAFGRAARYVIFPTLSRVQDEPERLRRAFIRGTHYTALCGLPASVLVPILAPETVDVLLGEKWRPLIPVLTVLGVGIYFRLGYKPVFAFLQAQGLARTTVRIQSIYLCLVIVGCLIAAPFGLTYVGAAVVVAVAANFFETNRVALRALNVTYSTLIGALLPAVFLATAMGVLAYAATTVLRPFENSFITLVGAGLFAGVPIAASVAFSPLRRTMIGRQWDVSTANSAK